MKIHFIGIGGIGISGLAQYMKFRGHEVSGSDISDSLITKKLRDLGISVTVPHDASAITNQDLVVHSAIIRPDNPEVVAAKEKGIEVHARREALPFILGDRKVYSVAGAHGKSTTTAILTAIIMDQLLSVLSQKPLAQMYVMMKTLIQCSLKQMRVMEAL